MCAFERRSVAHAHTDFKHSATYITGNSPHPPMRRAALAVPPARPDWRPYHGAVFSRHGVRDYVALGLAAGGGYRKAERDRAPAGALPGPCALTRVSRASGNRT